MKSVTSSIASLSAAILVFGTFAVGMNSARAAMASDNAGNYSGWGSTAGSASQPSSGSGFGSWSFSNTAGGNGSENGSFLGGSPNINSSSGNAWGLYANSSQTANAVAPFSGGAMTAGEQLSIQMQNGSINSGGSEGFSLRDSSHNNRFEFYFNGGDMHYTVNVWDGSNNPHTFDTGVGFTSGGLTLAFTQGTGNTWSLDITPIGGSTTTVSSSTTGMNLSASTISEVRFFNFNAGGGNNDYFNNLALVPETSNVALAVFGGLFVIGGFARNVIRRSARSGVSSAARAQQD